VRRSLASTSATCAAAALVAAGPAWATFPGRNGRIAFADTGARTAWTARPDGTGVQRIRDRVQFPRWSPSGGSLVVVSKGAIWRSKPTGSRLTRVFSPQTVQSGFSRPWRGREAAYAPDGRHLLYVANVLEAGTIADNGIFTVTRRGNDPLRIYDGYASDVTWSPDGSQIAFVSGNGTISTIRPDGTGLRVVFERPDAIVRSLDFSPDGRRLLFQFQRRLRILTLATGGLRTVGQRSTGQVSAATWSPDGRRIAVLHLPRPVMDDGQVHPRRGQVRTVRPDGTGARLLFTLPKPNPRVFQFDHLAWQPR
jgi:WD40 repeat protein